MPKTIAARIYRACGAHEWSANKDWFLGALGPRALRKRSHRRGGAPEGQFSGTGSNSEKWLAPTGSALAEVRGGAVPTRPRTLTASDLRKAEDTLARSIAEAEEGSTRRDRHERDRFIFSVGCGAGLRVEETQNAPTAKIMTLRLQNAGKAETLRDGQVWQDTRA
ncbi:hypothetical protein [Mangrovicoccus sp. HB161399]|uniref:hypothetical protein n=1 Tax=Mangrovicoccus sp. HB161399 TaxID=2720392 RepID=UPI00155580F8|nr:hypothetical protein [Mangrovicoccus sp. HB161399]